MAQLQFGKGYLVNIGNPVFTPAVVGSGITGYVTPLVPAPEVVDQEDEIKMLKDALGIVEGVIAPNDCILKATFKFIPRGSTIADAYKSASLPGIGGFAITSLPILAVRKFSDAFNTGGGNTQPWFYFGGGSLNGEENGKEWSGTISLTRFFNITSATAIT